MTGEITVISVSIDVWVCLACGSFKERTEGKVHALCFCEGVGESMRWGRLTYAGV